MRGRIRALVLAVAVGAAAAACARGGDIAAPDGAGPSLDGAPADTTGGGTQTDTTGGRWGGFAGSGG